jgi:hypothetical protein
MRKVARPLPLIVVLKITGPGSFTSWTFIVPTMSKGIVSVTRSPAEEGMATPGPVNCRKQSCAAQETWTVVPLKVTDVGEPGSELRKTSALGKIKSPGWQSDADELHGVMYD